METGLTKTCRCTERDWPNWLDRSTLLCRRDPPCDSRPVNALLNASLGRAGHLSGSRSHDSKVARSGGPFQFQPGGYRTRTVNRRDSNAFEVSPRVRPKATVVVPLPVALNTRTTLFPTSASETCRTTVA